MLKPSFLSEDYLVSDEGYVLKKNRKQKLKAFPNRNGYNILHLMVNGKNIAIGEHTLVARAFCKGYSEELQVNHIDGNKRNNTASNLEWVTASENMIHASKVIKSLKTIRTKVYAYDSQNKKLCYSFKSVLEAAKFINCSSTTMSFVSRGYNSNKSKFCPECSYKGFYWRRYEEDVLTDLSRV